MEYHDIDKCYGYLNNRNDMGIKRNFLKLLVRSIMRSLTVVIFALTLAAGLTAPARNGTDNKVKDLVDAYLAFVEEAYVKLEPIQLKDVPAIPIVTLIPPIGILLSAANRTVSGFSKNIVNVEVVQNNTAYLRITYPEISLQADYKVGGIFYGRPIHGEGHATLNLINVTVDVNVTLCEKVIRHPLRNISSLQIAELSDSYNVGVVATNLTGLTVAGLTDQEVTQLLNSDVTTVLNLNIPIWERLESENVKSQLNRALIGSSIDDAINWLKKNTPEPSMLLSLIPTNFPSL